MDYIYMLIRGMQLSCIAFLINISTAAITWQSVIIAGILLVSVIPYSHWWTSLPYCIKLRNADVVAFNPLKGRPGSRSKEGIVSEELVHAYERDIARFVLDDYDPEKAESISHFALLKNKSQCLFAKTAKLWGSPEWKTNLSFDENILRCIPAMIKFSYVSTPLGLDGFLIELPGKKYGEDLQAFASAVNHTLRVISGKDPAGFNCMNKSYIHQRGWVFRFNKETYFVTSFAPCYPRTSSRFSYECLDAYILLQPEMSFAQHDIPFDTPKTNYQHPKTIRDKIRTSFKQAGRPYLIRKTVNYPMAFDIVKPLTDSETPVEWWNMYQN